MTMRIRLALVLAAAVSIIGSNPSRASAAEGPTDEAVRLVNQGQVERAIEILQKHLKANAKDVKARGLLGEVLQFDGRPDEAVAVWEAGLTGRDDDYPLLMSIGEARDQQGTGGPTITRKRGVISASPSKNEAEDARYKREHLALAAAAYEKARKLRPEEASSARALASVYSAQGKHDAAIAVWTDLLKRAPKVAESHLDLALELQKAKRADAAAQELALAIKLNPRLAQAHEALATIQKEQGHEAAATESQKRAEFYKRLPEFCHVLYSEENQQTLANLNQEDSVRKLIADPSDSASELLATLCWTHPHNRLEDEAFEALEARGDKTTALLQSLLEESHSTCTIKSTAHILARRKTEGLFDYLAQMLPRDLRGFSMDMDIAGSLDDLGDVRAVRPLAELLNPAGEQGGQAEGLLLDRDSARARAALALGAFDTAEARRALEAGTRDKQLAPYCWAALYRLTGSPKHLAALESAASPPEGYKTYILVNYLIKKVKTDPARKLAKKWNDTLEAQRAAEVKKKAAKP